MTLREAVDKYVAWRKSHGAKFRAGESILRLLLNCVGGEVSCDFVTTEQIRTFLAGDRPLTRYRYNKYVVLEGFFRYAMNRGYAACSPMPNNEPKRATSAPPYVYSQDELRRIFRAIDISRKRALQLDSPSLRALLLLLYGAGLRLGEAIRLTLVDVDLQGGVLSIRRSKFYKSRLVPVGPQLLNVLVSYANLRAGRPTLDGKHSPFLANRNGTALAESTIHAAFAKVLSVAGIRGTDTGRQSPRLHSFRHSFAVHRLTEWYRQGADVQRLLPILSTYLGHSQLVHTQVYLSMTPELLQEASLRLERYRNGEYDD